MEHSLRWWFADKNKRLAHLYFQNGKFSLEEIKEKMKEQNVCLLQYDGKNLFKSILIDEQKIVLLLNEKTWTSYLRSFIEKALGQVLPPGTVFA